MKATLCLVVFVHVLVWVPANPAFAEPDRSESDRLKTFVNDYCVDCHQGDSAEAGLNLDSLAFPFANDDRETWEAAWKRVATRQMPPPDADRPDESEYAAIETYWANVLDDLADEHPRISGVDRIRRMTRTEYGHAVADLLAVDVDVSQWIPRDESSDGFDHLTVGELSPAAMSRYLTAAQKISRMAVGRPRGVPTGFTVRLPPDLTQESHLEGLPLGTRGGVSIPHTFSESGTYRIAVRLTRDRDEKIEGLDEAHDLDFLLDKNPMKRIHIDRPKGGDFTLVDANLTAEIEIIAGHHEVAVTFPSKSESLREIKRQPFDAAYNRHRHPRNQPAIFEVSIVGPLDQTNENPSANENDANKSAARESSPIEPTQLASRKQILTTQPRSEAIDDIVEAAEAILKPILRRAYRREVIDGDLVEPVGFVKAAVVDGEGEWQQRFELGIENAIASILANPHFLFRVETTFDSGDQPYRISDYELASRLSFFLWSSLPDETLLDLAAQGTLHEPGVLNQQVRRMMQDDRSLRLVSNFGRQWLRLRNLDSITPDLRQFPDFDENLRRAFSRETELLLEWVIRQNAPITALIDSPFTFMNERLATHYGIADVRGSHFRRVDLPADSRRGGILRHGSLLMVTSYATRTAPTIRGAFVLETLLGTPPPPPPPNVPALKEPAAGNLGVTSIRQRLARHRADPACASCHQLMDPVGFALENYDAVGRWRVYDGEIAVDSAGALPDGAEVFGPADLEQQLLARPDAFASAVAEKLLTFAVGRPVDFQDAAAIREIVHHSGHDDHRFASLVEAIVASEPFQFRFED